MSGDIVHSIFYQSDGERCASRLKEFFSGRKYNVQFNLHELQNEYITNHCNLGVSILVFTPHLHAFIMSRMHVDLNAIFPNPDLSVVLVFGVEKTRVEIRTLLSSRIRDFHKWTIMEYQADVSLNTLDKDVMKLVEKSEGFQPAPSLQKFRVWTREGVKSHEEVLLIFTKPVDNDSKVKVIQEWDSRERMAQPLNPMIYSFTVGDVDPGERKIEVLVNGFSFGRSTLHVPCVISKMEEISKLLHDIVNPIELLCQCLHIVPATLENLDRTLRDLLSNNTSSVSHIFEELNWKRFGDSNSNYELPTLLHFGAKYGLRLFCMELLSHPGGTHALKMKNKDGLLPDQIAQKGRFDELAMDLHAGKTDFAYLGTMQSSLRRIKTKAPIYLDKLQSPFRGEANVMESKRSSHDVEINVSDTNNGPQPCTMYQTNSLRSSRSSTSYLKPLQQGANVTASHTNSVRSSDSGIGEEIYPKSNVRELGKPQTCMPSSRGHSSKHERFPFTELEKL